MTVKIHFLNVGHGDCTIIEFPSGRLTIIDINNSRVLDEDTARELAAIYGYERDTYDFFEMLHKKPQKIKDYEENILTDPIAFLKARFPGRDIFRFILTHPDMDHMTGLYRLRQEGVGIVNFWDTRHSVSKSDKYLDWENTPYDIRDWQEYQRLRKTTSVRFYGMGDQYSYFHEDGIRIWWPPSSLELKPTDEVNLVSYLLEIRYGECSIWLGGDVPESVWNLLYNANNLEYPKVNLLKASHHGRKSGYHWPSVKAMKPDWTIVSVGKLLRKDDASASYEKHSTYGCYSTRFEGNITAHCSEFGHVSLYNQNDELLG